MIFRCPLADRHVTSSAGRLHSRTTTLWCPSQVDRCPLCLSITRTALCLSFRSVLACSWQCCGSLRLTNPAAFHSCCNTRLITHCGAGSVGSQRPHQVHTLHTLLSLAQPHHHSAMPFTGASKLHGPIATPSDAIAEFKSMFQRKCGVEWTLRHITPPESYALAFANTVDLTSSAHCCDWFPAGSVRCMSI